jgi:UDP-N-acetylglucosamine pyrophosphorylase
LDKNKKIFTKEKGRIDYGSAGAGNILAALMKYKVFDTWKKQGIKHVNIVGTENLKTRVCDPLALAYLTESNFDCLADIVPNQDDSIKYPVILKKANGSYDQFYPFEVQQINFKRNMKLAQYMVPYLNIYCSVDQIYQMCYKNHKELFTYRIREKLDGEGYKNDIRRVEGENNLPEKFRFVQNIFCLMGLSNRNCLILRNPKEMLMWDNKEVREKGHALAMSHIVDEYVKNAEKHAQKFGRDTSQIPKEKIFEGYISKFYNIRECEKYFFGNATKHSPSSS